MAFPLHFQNTAVAIRDGKQRKRKSKFLHLVEMLLFAAEERKEVHSATID